MAIDIHIHVDDGLTQDDYRCFFADQEGSSYFREDGTRCRDENGRLLWPCRHQDRIWSMPDILAGRSPWPFAGHLPETVEELLQSPDPVGALVETFPPGGRLPVPITPERAERGAPGARDPKGRRGAVRGVRAPGETGGDRPVPPGPHGQGRIPDVPMNRGRGRTKGEKTVRNTLTSARFQAAYRIATAATLLAALGLFAHSIITGAENWVWVIRTVMGAALMNSILGGRNPGCGAGARNAPHTRQ